MAGDWIPMRIDLASDPAVLQMADATGMSEKEVVGNLHAVWSWASLHCNADVTLHVTLDRIKRVTQTELFLDAMCAAGWIREVEIDGIKGIEFPNWDRWLSQSAKARRLTANRVARHRNQKCNADVTPGALPENRREQNRRSKRELKFSSEDMALAQEMWDDVRTLVGVSPPKMDAWADTIRLMVKRDGRSHEEIRSLFKWAHRDTFWRTNIRCPAKLREQWETLTVKRDNGQATPARNNTLAAKNREAAERWKARKAAN